MAESRADTGTRDVLTLGKAGFTGSDDRRVVLVDDIEGGKPITLGHITAGEVTERLQAGHPDLVSVAVDHVWMRIVRDDNPLGWRLEDATPGHPDAAAMTIADYDEARDCEAGVALAQVEEDCDRPGTEPYRRSLLCRRHKAVATGFPTLVPLEAP